VAELVPDTGEATAAEIREKGRKALAVPTDVRNVDQVKNLAQKTLDAFGKVDILVNNAGGSTGVEGKFVLELSYDEWRKPLELNLDSVFICCRFIGEAMAKQESGCIINISSGSGLGPMPGSSADAAAKAGVNHFTKTLAKEWGQYKIRVNAILPGLTETPLTAGSMKDPGRLEAVLEHIPMGRIGKPEDIANTAVFLASDAASYISGELIYVSGGLISVLPMPNKKPKK
jgi:3-oxoacyl-[acyl-carrier protein] reductase